MRLGQIGANGYGVQTARVQRRDLVSDSETKRCSSRFVRRDSCETSGIEVRKADSLKEVKKRVDTNFYESEAVNNDLAEVFTKLFDR